MTSSNLPITTPSKQQHLTTERKTKRNFLAASALILTLMAPALSHAYSPIAHTDVVPYQRIDKGTSFNFGVVAFSKPGISKVTFTIAGQGYNGGVKQATTMRHNTRVKSARYAGVYEYFVTLSSSEFSGNGEITVTPKVYDNNNNTRTLKAVKLIVEGSTTDFNQKKAWVNAQSSDGTGTVGSSSDPFPSIQAAVTAAQNANGGKSSGNIIYLAEGTYSISGLSANTTAEWLTLTKASNANRNNVIINKGKAGIKYLKYDNLTIKSTGSGQYVIAPPRDGYRVWTNSCRFIGSGVKVSNSNPVSVNPRLSSHTTEYYSTDDYMYNSLNGYATNQLVRGAVVDTIGNDVFHNTRFVVNARVTNVSNRGTGQHSDVLQVYQNDTTQVPVENRLVYNLYATDAHYQGIMRTSIAQSAKNNAYINVFIEMREKSDNDETGQPEIKSMLNSSTNDHLLIWHSSFPYSATTIGSKNTNSSFIGNVFWQLRNTSPGSSSEFLYNHYMHAYNKTPSCTQTSWDKDRNAPCPAPSSVVLDTGSGTAKWGSTNLMNLSNFDSSSFGFPLSGSALRDRLPKKYVMDDALGNMRDSKPDIGALEYLGSQPPSPTEPPVTEPPPTEPPTTTIPGPSNFRQIQ